MHRLEAWALSWLAWASRVPGRWQQPRTDRFARRYRPWPWDACARVVALALGAWLLGGLAGPAWAIALFPRDGGPPVIGYLVREDERQIVVREEQPDGSTREVRLLKSQIEERIDAFSPQRLQALTPDRPGEYLEYAEELAERRRDPEARDTALRLYLIAIARGDDLVRRQAWRGLVALARTPAQRQTFQAAAAWHGVPLAGTSAPAAASRSGEGTVVRAVLLEALVRLRQGRGREARALLDRPGVRDEAALLAPWISWEELVAACSQQELNLPLLVRLLQGELKLRSPADEGSQSQRPKWSQARAGNGLAPLPSLELDALTPFDPAECMWRDGRWQRP